MSGIKDIRPSKKSRYKQGYINSRTCKKIFEGLRSEPVIYRSSYERDFIYWMEGDKRVRKWGSECIGIRYYYNDGWHTYYPDYFIEMMNGEKYVIEIKPKSQTMPPEPGDSEWSKDTYSRNVSKWKAAKKFCESRGYKFRILTEKTIGVLF